LPPDVIFLKLKCTKFDFGGAPDPALGELDLKGPTSKGREGEGGRVRRRGEGFFFIFKHSWAPKTSSKIFHEGPGKSWKSPGFFVSKRVGTLYLD